MPATLPRIRLKTGRRSNHPWIFERMVERPARRPEPGSIVDIEDREGTWCGRGFYNGNSGIALRVLTVDPAEAVDAAFFEQRISRAVALRREALALDEVTDAYRLVHSEGDELSGLVVDRFGDLIVAEYFSAGMWCVRDHVRAALERCFPGTRYHEFAEEYAQEQEGLRIPPPSVPEPAVITEHGVKFHAAPGTKHKTGFFADQRDNRLRLSQFTKGARVLDLCCNSGGFGLYAKTIGGADEVVGLDLDEEILAVAQDNAKLNRVRLKYVQADLFPWLRDVVIGNGERFDVVILDPAKMTRDRDSVIPALKKYLDMNKLALAAVKPGGIFLTCSCTGLVSEADFLEMLRRAAFYAERTVQVLQVTGAGPDHPFLASVPESRYLKAALCRVY